MANRVRGRPRQDPAVDWPRVECRCGRVAMDGPHMFECILLPYTGRREIDWTEKSPRRSTRSTLSPQAALRVVDEIGSIRRAVDGIAARRRSGSRRRLERTRRVALMARLLGTSSGEVRAAIETATQLESCRRPTQRCAPDSLRTRSTADRGRGVGEPGCRTRSVGRGRPRTRPLRDACIAARAQVEAPAERAGGSTRERRARIRSEADGMIAGTSRLTPEVGDR